MSGAISRRSLRVPWSPDLVAGRILIGLPAGLGLALIRWANVPVAGRIVAVYVSMLRANAVVTLLLLLFFALPNVGLPVDPYAAAILASPSTPRPSTGEIWRAALMDFPKDQYEAAQSVGMTAEQRFRRIVFPQIARTSLPVLVNEMVAPDQGHAGPGGGGRGRHHPRGRPDGCRNLRAPAAAPGGGGALCPDRLRAGLVAALDRAPAGELRGRGMIHDFGIVWANARCS